VDSSEREVDQIGKEDPHRDRELEQRHIAAPALLGGDLGDIDRNDRGREADRDPEDRASSDQDGRGRCDGGDDRAEDEDERRAEDERPAAGPVAERGGERGTDNRADEDGADHHSLAGRSEMEALLDEQQRARDHAGVVAEQQTAQRRHGRDE
jgi:hypothetical protein